MNPIGILCVAISSGCGGGLVVWLNGLRIAQDAAPAPVPDGLDVEWSSIAAEVSDELAKRQKVRRQRSDTLRGIYLADLAAAAEQLEEAPAQ